MSGADIQNIQNNITAVVNGNITNANVNASADVVESKLLFDTTSGHYHNGTDSRLVHSSFKHYRRGLQLYGDDDTNICVRAGSVDVGGTMVTKAAVSGDIVIATDGNWKDGTAPASVTDTYIYVLIDNAGNYKLDENPPAYSYTDDTTAELPLRYHKQTSTYYRYLGAVYCDAAGDLCWGQGSSEGLFATNFDASNMCTIGGLGTGSDQTFNTIWTPKWVRIVYGSLDTTPAENDALTIHEATPISLTTTFHTAALNFGHEEAGGHQWELTNQAGTVNAITTQAAGTSGSFTIDAMTDDHVFYAIAWTDGI